MGNVIPPNPKKESSKELLSFLLKTKTSSGSNDGLEVGMVAAWTLSDDPSDSYLECNGQTVDKDKYPKLYALMTTVPDYRGYFLRGLGGNSDDLGVAQEDAIRNITGTFGYFADRHGTYFSGAFYCAEERSGSHSDNNGSNWRAGFNASRVVPTAEENRPVNKAVRYFIKAR